MTLVVEPLNTLAPELFSFSLTAEALRDSTPEDDLADQAPCPAHKLVKLTWF